MKGTVVPIYSQEVRLGEISSIREKVRGGTGGDSEHKEGTDEVESRQDLETEPSLPVPV